MTDFGIGIARAFDFSRTCLAEGTIEAALGSTGAAAAGRDSWRSAWWRNLDHPGRRGLAHWHGSRLHLRQPGLSALAGVLPLAGIVLLGPCSGHRQIFHQPPCLEQQGGGQRPENDELEECGRRFMGGTRIIHAGPPLRRAAQASWSAITCSLPGLLELASRPGRQHRRPNEPRLGSRSGSLSMNIGKASSQITLSNGVSTLTTPCGQEVTLRPQDSQHG